jgi:uncharacterized protein (TIGR02246 family)
MLHRRLFTTAAMAGIAVPAVAQTRASASDPESQKISDALTEEYIRAYNAGNAGGVAATFSESSAFVTPAGPVLHGRQAIEAAIGNRMRAGWTRQTASATEAHRMGDAIWAIGEYTLTGSGPVEGKTLSGRYTHILQREGNAWRAMLLMGNILPQQDPTGMSSTQTR